MVRYIKELVYFFCHRILWLLFYIPSIKLRVLLLRICGAKIGKNVSIHMGVKIIAPWNLSIGNNSTINSSCMIDARGVITISENVMIGYKSSVHSIGHKYKEDDFPVFKAEVNIKNNVIIFSHCFIGPGVLLNSGCTLLPKTVVLSGQFDSGTTLLGNPYKVLDEKNISNRGKQFHNSPFGF